MSETSGFELPSAHEKQAYKFILDSIKETQTSEMMTEGIESPEPDPVAPQTQSFTPTPLPPEKKYFRIGEVAELIGVEAYVLRYWETEFRLVRPSKSGSGHRVYSRKDVEALQWIRHLLHVEKFSIKGAKKKLVELRHATPEAHSSQAIPKTDFLKSLAQEVRHLIQVARGNPGIM